MPEKQIERVLSQWAKSRTLRTAGPLFGAIMVQVFLLVITIFVVVFVPSNRDKPEFVAHKTIYLPQKELEHKVSQAAFEQVASPPMMMERLQSQSLAEHALPALPKLPDAAFSSMVAPVQLTPSEALFGSAGMAGLAGDYSGSASSLSFFGIKDSGKRVVIAFDVSKSVLSKAESAGVSVVKIKEEAKRLIEGLSANTSFGVIQFIRRYEVFEEHLVAGTGANKKRAIEWLEDEFHTSGYSPTRWRRIEDGEGQVKMDGIQAVMRVIFNWEPDVIFMISDAGFGRNYPSRLSRIDLDELDRDINKLQRELPEKARIHFIGFEVRHDRESGIKKIVRKSAGKYRSF